MRTHVLAHLRCASLKVMGELGGIGIIVSDTAIQETTAASYALTSPAEVWSEVRLNDWS